MSEPLWTDERINKCIADVLIAQPNHTPRGLVRRVAYGIRDDMQAEIDELRAELAQGWQPVEDGEYYSDLSHSYVVVVENGIVIKTVMDDDPGVDVVLPDNLRLCRCKGGE